MPAGVQFTVDVGSIRAVKRAVQDYQAEQRERVRVACVEIAQVLEAYAITHHPWTVETGATNVTTHGTYEQLSADLYEVVLSAGMDYDVDLEIYRGGKWSWLWPDLLANQDEIMAILARHLSH